MQVYRKAGQHKSHPPLGGGCRRAAVGGALSSFAIATPARLFHFGKLIPRYQVQVPRNRDKPEYSASDVQSSSQQGTERSVPVKRFIYLDEGGGHL